MKRKQKIQPKVPKIIKDYNKIRKGLTSSKTFTTENYKFIPIKFQRQLKLHPLTNEKLS